MPRIAIVIKIWLTRVYLKFSGYVMLLKLMMNGNPNIIACGTRFVMHYCN
jgi:hypothetical protein